MNLDGRCQGLHCMYVHLTRCDIICITFDVPLRQLKTLQVIAFLYDIKIHYVPGIREIWFLLCAYRCTRFTRIKLEDSI